MKFLSKIIRNIVLRGRIKDWRVLSSARKLELDYLKRIITIPNTSDGKPSPNRIETANAATLKPALNRILFIGDCLWEQDQLFPEIRKICNLDVVNLRDFINTTESQTEAVLQAIERQARDQSQQDPNLIFFYARPALLSEPAFDAIRKRWSCPVIGMNLDDRVEFFDYKIFSRKKDNYSQWIHHFDLNLTSSIAAADWYRQLGAEVRYMPQGFCVNPRFLQPPDCNRFEYPLSFVGSMKPERSNLIEQIRTFGIEPALFGQGWKKSVWIDEPATVFRNSQINLGIGYTLASAGIANAKGRDIECPAVSLPRCSRSARRSFVIETLTNSSRCIPTTGTDLTPASRSPKRRTSVPMPNTPGKSACAKYFPISVLKPLYYEPPFLLPIPSESSGSNFHR